jgi:hypothetical protein
MNASHVLGELRAAGVRIEARQDGHLYFTPKERLTDSMVDRVRECKPELLALLVAHHCENVGADLRAYLADRQPNLLSEPTLHSCLAESIVRTCKRYGVALRMEPDGTLVVNCDKAVGLTPGDWDALKYSLEAHTEAVAALVKSGWTLHANFPEHVAA